MDAFAHTDGTVLAPGIFCLGHLPPRTVATVRDVGRGAAEASPLERRLIELGFVRGERVEVLTQAAPGGDPFVVRIGDSTFALRRREVATVWVEIAQPGLDP